jgi:hypothetical protein
LPWGGWPLSDDNGRRAEVDHDRSNISPPVKHFHLPKGSENMKRKDCFITTEQLLRQCVTFMKNLPAPGPRPIMQFTKRQNEKAAYQPPFWFSARKPVQQDFLHPSGFICQSARVAPVGSVITLNQPIPGISVTSLQIFAPRDLAFSVAATASATRT